jgi:4-hydroxyphenylpyruvate dioxygenase
MRRSIATVCLSGTLPEKLQAIAAARFDAVEIFENDLLSVDGPARGVRAMAEDLGLGIALLQPFRDFEGVPEQQFRRNLDRAERKFDLMAELGAPLLLVCSNVGAAIPDDGLSAAQLRALAERAARRGLRVGFEALAWGTHARTFGDAWRIVERAAHPHLGVILDSFHTLALEDDPAGIGAIPGHRIFFVQLADAPRLKMDALSWSRHFRCLPGQGDLDVAGFVTEALKAGYSGPLSIEVFNDTFRGGSTRQIAQDGMRSLLFLEERVRRSAQAVEPTVRAWTRRVELLDPPPPPAVSGVAFVEFAVEHESKAALAALLGGLTFQGVGRHRSKDVTLYRQGGVNLVLNAEPDSFAHAYYLVHGPSVCALALAVEDPAQAMARAQAFGCAGYQGRLGPEERDIPAIRAPDGSLIYFVPPDFDFATDFAITAEIGTGHGLTAVDHIAQAVPEGQFDSWILFHRAVLGLEPEDIWVLPDPYGLVRSRALRSPNRSLRVPLNFSQGSRTATARSVSTYAGAGVHHIAFAANDILAAVAAIRAAGVAMLPIPETYYDDLRARFDLAEPLLANLIDRGILYDRDAAGGEFLHAYTLPFEDRFFFEVVQRIGGYDQYGAANAPVRMAAQARLRDHQIAGIY